MSRSDLSGVVAGAGSIGRRHARNFRELGVDLAVADPDERAREAVTSDFDLVTYPALTDALDVEDPDFVVVASPNRFHVEQADEAARAGYHVLVEKPLSHAMEGVAALESVIEDRDLVSLVGCNLRFHPEIRKMRELLEAGRIGNVVAARIEVGSHLPEWFPETDYRKSYSAREDLGGGVILDCIHEINYARWFFGEFDAVSAMAGTRSSLDIETNDLAGILAETESGVLCEFHLDYVQRSYSRSCHVIGEEGTIRWSWPDERVEWYVADEDRWHTYDRPDDWDTNDMYVEEVEHFLDCVRHGCETTCDVACGRRDLEVALAARESAECGRRVHLGG